MHEYVGEILEQTGSTEIFAVIIQQSEESYNLSEHTPNSLPYVLLENSIELAVCRHSWFNAIRANVICHDENSRRS